MGILVRFVTLLLQLSPEKCWAVDSAVYNQPKEKEEEGVPGQCPCNPLKSLELQVPSSVAGLKYQLTRPKRLIL